MNRDLINLSHNEDIFHAQTIWAKIVLNTVFWVDYINTVIIVASVEYTNTSMLPILFQWTCMQRPVTPEVRIEVTLLSTTLDDTNHAASHSKNEFKFKSYQQWIFKWQSMKTTMTCFKVVEEQRFIYIRKFEKFAKIMERFQI